MKSNHLFLNNIASKRDDQSSYEKEVKSAVCQNKQCIAHFLHGAQITTQKVIEVIKKKGISKITFRGVGAKTITELQKALMKRFPAKLFTLNESESISTTMQITIKPTEMNVEKSEELSVA